jgi:serine/threonine protein kinase
MHISEYGMDSQLSTEGDMYSFGILLLEMLTGRRPTDDIFKEGHNLHNYVKIAFPNNFPITFWRLLMQLSSLWKMKILQ